MKSKIYIVCGENSGEPEYYVLGLYPTEKLAKDRAKECEYDMDKDKYECYEYTWYDVVEVGPEGGSCSLCNR